MDDETIHALIDSCKAQKSTTQISIEDRWKVVKYVQTLQKQ